MKKIFIILLSINLLAGCATARPALLQRANSDDLGEANKLVQRGHYLEAIDELGMFLEMNSTNEQARYLRGVAYQKLGRYEDAVKDYEQIIKKNPKSSKAYYNLGMIYAFQLKIPDRALAYFDNFLMLAPQHDQALAVAKIMCSIDKDGNAPDLTDPNLQQIIDQAMGTKDTSGRRKLLLQGIQLNPNSPVLYYLVGQTYEGDGENREAIRYYRLALDKQPTCSRCHRSLGNLLLQTKNEEDGQLHLLKAKLFDPNSQES